MVLRGDDPVAVAVDQIEGIRERNDDAADWLDLRETIAHVFQKATVREPSALPAASAAEARADEGERELSFVQFTLAGQRFAFPIAEVRAVIRAPAELVAVPEADPVVRGLTNHGEAVLPVVELADLLGLPRPGRERASPAVRGGNRRRGCRSARRAGFGGPAGQSSRRQSRAFGAEPRSGRGARHRDRADAVGPDRDPGRGAIVQRCDHATIERAGRAGAGAQDG